MVWPIVIGAAIGAAKHYSEQEEARRQRKLSAAMMRNSPWTGMTMEPPKNPNMVGNISSGALTGAQMDQNMAKTAALRNAASGETTTGTPTGTQLTEETVPAQPYGVMQQDQNGLSGSPIAGNPDYTSPWWQQPTEQPPAQGSYGVMQQDQNPMSYRARAPWGYMK